jgi:hypothetical protein
MIDLFAWVVPPDLITRALAMLFIAGSGPGDIANRATAGIEV